MLRRVLIAVVVLAALAVLAAGSAWIVWHDTYQPYVNEVTVPVRGLEREVRLVQVSDMHGREFGAHQAEIRRLLADAHPDAAVLTGDTLDTHHSPPRPAYDIVAALRTLTPRVYFLPGNHDPHSLGEAIAANGAIVLQPAEVGTVGPGVDIVYGADAAAILSAETSATKERVFAAHTPPGTERLEAGRRVATPHLFIAGHTHGGQYRLPLIGAIAAPSTWDGEDGPPGTTGGHLFPDLRGMLVHGRYHREGQDVFVSVGIGATSIPPFGRPVRFLDRAEIVLYRFVPEP